MCFSDSFFHSKEARGDDPGQAVMNFITDFFLLSYSSI
uniref:Uncharacterized protein n=1 Tax=Arundo donax TaxID=35708 RepID=A0A0A8ZXL8_ARUDO